MANQRLVGSCVSKTQNEDYSLQSEYEHLTVLTIEEAIKDLSGKVPGIENYVSTAKENCYRGSHLLTWDESAAIYLYTMQTASSVCGFNASLRAGNRQALRLWLGYIKLLVTALEKLPPTKTTIWRGTNDDRPENYAERQVSTLWGITSCSKNLEIVRNYMSDNGILFAIETVHGKDISMFSANGDEEEVLLLPGTRLRAKANTSHFLDKLFMTHFEEVQSPK